MGKFLKNKKIFFFIFLGIFLIASQALALELSWPPSPGPDHIILTESTPLNKLVQYFYEWGIFLGGLAAFIALIIAGFQYLTSVGDPARMKDAMDRIKSTLLGLVLLLGSWLILNTINPELTTLRLPPTRLEDIGQLECGCPKDAVCPDCLDPKENYECVGDENPGDGKKEGICIMKKKEELTCEKAQVFAGPDYDDSEGSDWIHKPGETIEFSAKSVKVFTADGKDCCSDEAYEKGYYGCRCSLQVFSGGWFFGWGCGNMKAIVPGCEKRIEDYTDESIKCIKLIKSPY